MNLFNLKKFLNTNNKDIKLQKKIKELEDRLIHIEDKIDRLLRSNQIEIQKHINRDYLQSKTYDYYDLLIFGFWFSKNYGASLTSYALYTFLKNQSIKIALVDIPEIIYSNYKEYSCDSNLDRKFIKSFCKTTDFIKINDIYTLNALTKGYVIGSDVLWGWYKAKSLTEQGQSLLLNFASNKIKLSYATSFGCSIDELDITEFDRKIIANRLKDFACISVREKSGEELCKNMFNVESKFVLDPVFFFDSEHYITLCKEMTADIGDNCLLCYILQLSENKTRVIKSLANYFKLKIIFINDLNSDNKDYGEDLEIKKDIDVPMWLKYFSNAKFIITDSYHGMCFSLIFKKQFLTFSPRNGIERFKSLANFLELTNRVSVEDSNLEDLITLLTSPINYHKISKSIKEKASQDGNWFMQYVNNELSKNSESDQKIISNEIVQNSIRFDNTR